MREQEITWGLLHKRYRAIVDRGKFYHVIHIERTVADDGKDADFIVKLAACKKDAVDDNDPETVIAISWSRLQKTFRLRRDALNYSVSLLDEALGKLLRKLRKVA